MDSANNAEYEVLQRNAQELRKSCLDEPPDRLDFLPTELKILNGLKDLRKHDEVREPIAPNRDAECEAMEARIEELQTELGLDRLDRRSLLEMRLKNLESLKGCARSGSESRADGRTS